MPRKRVIVHAGMGKTGTTYLQRRFVECEEWLRQRGFDYPAVGRDWLHGHHDLAWALEGTARDGGQAADPEQQFAEILAGESPGVLLSSEIFVGLGQALARLPELLDGHEVVYVVFVRRRSALARSMWFNRVEHGMTSSFAEFLAKELLCTGSGTLRLEDPLVTAIEAFGLGALRVAVYDHLVDDGHDLFRFFVSQILGIDEEPPAAPSVAKVNPSSSGGVAEIQRRLHARSLAKARVPRASDSHAIERWLRRDEAGRALLAAVEVVSAERGEDLPLDRLDEYWQPIDREILAQCGGAVLNPAAPDRLFREAPARSIRTVEDRWFEPLEWQDRFDAAWAAVFAGSD